MHHSFLTFLLKLNHSIVQFLSIVVVSLDCKLGLWWWASFTYLFGCGDFTLHEEELRVVHIHDLLMETWFTSLPAIPYEIFWLRNSHEFIINKRIFFAWQFRSANFPILPMLLPIALITNLWSDNLLQNFLHRLITALDIDCARLRGWFLDVFPVIAFELAWWLAVSFGEHVFHLLLIYLLLLRDGMLNR